MIVSKSFRSVSPAILSNSREMSTTRRRSPSFVASATIARSLLRRGGRLARASAGAARSPRCPANPGGWLSPPPLRVRAEGAPGRVLAGGGGLGVEVELAVGEEPRGGPPEFVAAAGGQES